MKFSFFSNKEMRSDTRKESDLSSLMFQVEALSETGPVRQQNEDAISYSYLNETKSALTAVLADGMGGHNAGEVASRMACDFLLQQLSAKWKNEKPGKEIDSLLKEANQKITQAGAENEDQKGMGTTAIAVLLKDKQLYFGHVGDSRLYIFSSGILRQLSQDHTLVNQMVEKGTLSKEDAGHHPMKHVLFQALGSKGEIHPQIESEGISMNVGDRVLLCSDGMYEVFSQQQLESIVGIKDPAFALECLRALAIERRANDNFSVILISCVPAATVRAGVTREQNLMQ